MSKTDAKQSGAFTFDDIYDIGIPLRKLGNAVWFAEDPACKKEDWSVLQGIRQLITLLEDEGDGYERALKSLSDHVDDLDDEDLPCDIVELYHVQVVPKIREIGTYYYAATCLLEKEEIEKARNIVVRLFRRNLDTLRLRLAVKWVALSTMKISWVYPYSGEFSLRDMRCFVADLETRAHNRIAS